MRLHGAHSGRLSRVCWPLFSLLREAHVPSARFLWGLLQYLQELRVDSCVLALSQGGKRPSQSVDFPGLRDVFHRPEALRTHSTRSVVLVLLWGLLKHLSPCWGLKITHLPVHS